MTSHVPSDSLPPDSLPRRLFTVADVEAMVVAGIIEENERVELLGGELVPMSPKGCRHETLKIELNRLWNRLAPDNCIIAPETTLRLSVDTYLEPDFVVYERTTKLAALNGANALLVVEVSDSSLRYDIGRKTSVYASFGVRELWVIDVVHPAIRVFREPAVDGYRQVEDVAADDVASPLVAPQIMALRLADLDLD